jgi:N4-gp56 family major capsid protein
MGQTIIGVNDPKAVKKYSAFLAVDVARDSYFSRKFMGGPDSSMPIHLLKELESEAGDTISFDLSMQLKMQPVEGDSPLEGKEEDLKFYTDSVQIDQMRGGVNTGGRMSRKRTIYDLRDVARKRQGEWWARVFDELFMMYLSGARGVNADYVFPAGYAGFAGNALSAPDSGHIIYAGSAGTKSGMVSSDKMSLTYIDKAIALASMMGGGIQGVPKIQPILINGEKHFVLVMNPWQVYDLRTSTNSGQWMDIQKAAAAAEGRKSPIFQGGLGMYNNVVLHEHQAVIRFSDYGSGQNVEAARAIFLGFQAAVLAFGTSGTGLRFGWHEEERDNGNQVVITTHSIFGINKVTFNGLDFGIMAIDSAAKQP